MTVNINKKKIERLKSIINTLQKLQKENNFTLDFENLLNGADFSIFSFDNNSIVENKSIYKYIYKIHPFLYPKEIEEKKEFYIESLIYLFALWSYKYITGKEYDNDLNEIKIPGLYQFFSKSLEEFTKRVSSLLELEIYLDIAIKYLNKENYKKFEDDNLFIEGFTTEGMVRYENQDYFDFKVNNSNILLVIADGMGGGLYGDVASKIAVNTFINNFEKIGSSENINETLKDLVLEANTKIINYKKSKKALSMGTTLSAVFIKGNEFFFVHVGDSRIYLKKFNDSEYFQITQDHSVAEIEFRKGNISLEEKEQYNKSILAFVLGSENLSREDINSTDDIDKVNFDEIEEVILCTDGCWDIVDTKDFGRDVFSIIEQANSLITHDNTTILKLKKISKTKIHKEDSKITYNRENKEKNRKMKTIQLYNQENKNALKRVIFLIIIEVLIIAILIIVSILYGSGENK